MRPLRIRLWSWNYSPEPTGMGPIAAVWAEGLQARGHGVSVVTAFPHYPPIYPQGWRPYREVRNGVRVLRLPLLIGHATTGRRVLEELTYCGSAACAAAFTSAPHVAALVSPSFLALQPVLRAMRWRRVPTVLWLQDILPDAAETTGLLLSGRALRAARSLEGAAYQMADRIVVISKTFRRNLLAKGVPDEKIRVIYNPATRGFTEPRRAHAEPRILAMGNIGHSQGLAAFVRAFEASEVAARLVITGIGEELESLRAEVRSSRVELLGLVSDERLDHELDRAAIGLVTQLPELFEFNVPSKLMTMMARGLPVFAFVRPTSEVQAIVAESGGGWVVDCSAPEQVGPALSQILSDPEGLWRRGERANAYATRMFALGTALDRFEGVIEDAIRLVRL